MSDIVIYEDGEVELSATVENKTVWLSQKQMAELFDVQRPAVTKHLNNIFKSGELDEKLPSLTPRLTPEKLATLTTQEMFELE